MELNRDALEQIEDATLDDDHEHQQNVEYLNRKVVICHPLFVLQIWQFIDFHRFTLCFDQLNEEFIKQSKILQTTGVYMV